MKKDKIHKDEIEWLVSVYKTSDDEELQKETYGKLIDYGLTDSQIESIFKKTDSDSFNAFDKAWAKQVERNEFEKYTLVEMIKIFLFGPYRLFKHYESGLRELRNYNYKIKFRQKLILLILGTIFWIFFIVGGYKYYEHKRIQKNENTNQINIIK
jgi:hypothetical protein